MERRVACKRPRTDEGDSVVGPQDIRLLCRAYTRSRLINWILGIGRDMFRGIVLNDTSGVVTKNLLCAPLIAASASAVSAFRQQLLCGRHLEKKARPRLEEKG